MSDIKTKKMWLPEAMELVKDLRVENEALQARINELERAPQVKVVSERLHTTKRCVNEIEAQGIEKMLDNVYYIDTDWGYAVFVPDIKDYADKLRAKQ